MEILNVLYNNNFVAVYLIGAILVVILLFIILSSLSAKPKETILKDPTEEEKDLIVDSPISNEELEEIEIPKINDLVEEIYQTSAEKEETKKNHDTLNSFLEDFEVPDNVIEEVTNNNEEKEKIIEEVIEINKEEIKKENIEDMLKRLYDLRQSEKELKRNTQLNEIYELKKQVDETLKSEKNYTFKIEIKPEALFD